MSQRLTTEIRNEIAKAALAHRFGDDVRKLTDKKAEFAASVYADIYSKANRQKMAELPDGWLFEAADIDIKFGVTFTRLSFRGHISAPLSKATQYKRQDVVRIPAKDKSGCVKAYEATHKLSAEHDRIEAEERSLRVSYSEAAKQIEAALASVSTIKRLVETWPEIAPFAARFNDAKVNLPALPTEQLNKIFDLPVAEAA